MTARTSPPPGPEQFAQRFLVPAQRIIERCLARAPQVDRHAAALQLNVILGGGWHLLAEGEVLGSGADPDLDHATRVLVRGAVGELSEDSQGRLLQRMDDGREDLLPGAEPSHFRAQLILEGLTWAVRVSAHARGAGVVVASIAGVLAPPARAAA
jgi:hypothetical protein